jgi:hypothetical protein
MATWPLLCLGDYFRLPMMKTRRASLRSGHLASGEIAEVKARTRHRPGIMHVFVPRDEEQVRGVSVLSPAMACASPAGPWSSRRPGSGG